MGRRYSSAHSRTGEQSLVEEEACPAGVTVVWSNAYGVPAPPRDQITCSTPSGVRAVPICPDTLRIPEPANDHVPGAPARIEVAPDTSPDELERLARESPRVLAQLNGRAIVKAIVVPGKLVNLVVQ